MSGIPFLILLHNHLNEAPEKFESVEDDNQSADYIDNAEGFIGELGTEQ